MKPRTQRVPVEPASVYVAVDGRALRAWRKRRGLTMAALAAAAGISRSYVSMIERGERSALHPAIVIRLAAALNLIFEELTP